MTSLERAYENRSGTQSDLLKYSWLVVIFCSPLKSAGFQTIQESCHLIHNTIFMVIRLSNSLTPVNPSNTNDTYILNGSLIGSEVGL